MRCRGGRQGSCRTATRSWAPGSPRWTWMASCDLRRPLPAWTCTGPTRCAAEATVKCVCWFFVEISSRQSTLDMVGKLRCAVCATRCQHGPAPAPNRTQPNLFMLITGALHLRWSMLCQACLYKQVSLSSSELCVMCTKDSSRAQGGLGLRPTLCPWTAALKPS